MARAHASLGEIRYAVTIDAGGHRIIADEPPANGGADAGPAPYDLLLASLAACTAITLQMYAGRKSWPLKTVTVDLYFTRDENKKEHIARQLKLEGALDEAQRRRLADVAERTPVTLTLKQGLAIDTVLLD